MLAPNPSNTYDCDSCSAEFRHWHLCEQHMDSLNHWIMYDCETCPRQFRSQSAARQHMSGMGHWAHQLTCETCDAVFESKDEAEGHTCVDDHHDDDAYCELCDREFPSVSCFRAHLKSKDHRGKGAYCPLCKVPFAKISDVFQHWESNTCPCAQSLTQLELYYSVDAAEHQELLNVLEWDEDMAALADDGTWKCNDCHSVFGSTLSLRQHLEDSSLKARIYGCLNCEKDFSSLGGVFSHLESTSCGYTDPDELQRVEQQILEDIAVFISLADS